MIPLEKQVTSLELSKRLKGIGVKQDGLYSYFQYDKWNVLLRETKEIFTPNNECGCNKGNLICSAFTVAEHGEALPSSIKTDYGSLNYLHITKLKNVKEWLIAYFHDEIRGDTEANARAKMRIYLVEHKLEEAK